ncbi:MAG TPA: LysM peptidoglycan-binding domain-containing protein [Acidimicrobiales bacterium]|nr:LysM peptidoglycan-binding domain-containing protein [Acidimicrobiales bacterium]
MTSAAALQPGFRLQPTTVPPGPGSPRRPALRVIEGGRAPGAARRRAVYRRRRLAALAVLTAAVVVVLLLANAVLAGPAGGGTPTSAAGTSAAAVHVVQPGDTLWSIARELAPGADVRLTVDRLVALNGHAALQVGQRLALP